MLFAGCTSENMAYQPSVEVDLRAPAYPLITIDPYTSGWSFTDNLYDAPIHHWTGQNQQMIGVIRVDGENYRFMGEEQVPMQMIVPTYEKENWNARYTTQKPDVDWTAENYDASSWLEGKGSFGSEGRLKAITSWTTPDIWVRREVNIDADVLNRDLFIEYSHDDGVEIYINGYQIINTGNSARADVMQRIPDEAKKHIRPGKNIIAAHCNDGGGESYLDFGIWMRKDNEQKFTQTARQTNVNVLPTRTFYTFEAGGVQLDVIFTAPLLMDNLDLMTRPVNYITYQVKATDGKTHDVAVYIEGSPQWAQDVIHQPIQSEMVADNNLHLLKSGTKTQQILGKSGDNTRIDWGYVYFAAPKQSNITSAIGIASDVQNQFLQNGSLGNTYSPSAKGDLTENLEALSIAHNLGKVGADYSTGYVMLAYDDIYSIQYFGDNLRPYWNRNGNQTITSQITAAVNEYGAIMKKCADFDAELMKEALAAGGKEYAELCALAYRQAISAHKLVQAPNGDLLWLSKENFSNGSIGTVDVTYPSAPLFLYYNTELAKGLLNHIFYYSESGKWNKPFPAHDVGTYPLANGQTYGGDMPVEEGGNMLALTAAIAAMEGNADYAAKHWDVLTIWTDYLVEKGLDPENQLCTDDFAGHFAHNINLSVKAIMGIASYGYLADMLGKKDVAEKYTNKAKEMAQEWMKMANDGDHYRLTFDKPGTWSQKYNLIWNKLLKYNVFPESVAQKEIAYYLTKQNQYGLPLDSRRNYTKSDWIIWTATLVDDDATFKKFITPIYNFYNETTDRVPMSDWYNTDNKTHVGFQARSVVGGYYIKMLEKKLGK
ncbi:glutaminase family protein [Bacteroides sp. 519]|uniref:glutaminase family protein n=1 Tax=Bacteroides sp. 519 TaxID=2302937 RepID=UPI001EF16669|nr:glutaminase family protein [Bacteroides sp. 519]